MGDLRSTNKFYALFKVIWKHTWGKWTFALCISTILHLGLFFSLQGQASHHSKQYNTVRFKLLRPPPPPPPTPTPPPQETKAPESRIEPKPKPKLKPKPKPKPKLKPKPKPKPSVEVQQPTDQKPLPQPNRQDPQPSASGTAQPIFGVTMESFGKQGSGQMSVPLGNTLMTEPDNKPRPKRVEPYVVPPATPPPPPPRPRDVFKPIPIFEIDENPKELKKVSAEYPPDAKRDGVEAVVVLSVQIRSNGQVRRARVISIRPTQAERYDFGRNAVRALQRYRFQPAKYQGRPVDVVVRYIYRFVLED